MFEQGNTSRQTKTQRERERGLDLTENSSAMAALGEAPRDQTPVAGDSCTTIIFFLCLKDSAIHK